MGLRDTFFDFLFGTINKLDFNHSDHPCSGEVDIPEAVSHAIMELKKEAAITDGGVDYDRVRKSSAYAILQSTIYPCLASFKLESLKTIEQQKAFWINLYNLLTIDAVLHLSIQKSVTNGWFGIIRFFRKAAYKIDGMRFSLEDIKHGILRENRGLTFVPGRHFLKNDPRRKYVISPLDPRIHFALNCASHSCPPIAYYTSDRLDAQLDSSAANFIDSETHMDKSSAALHISRIFKWYQKDFGGKFEVLKWIQRFLPENDIRRQLIDHFDFQTITNFKKYNWRLNKLE